MSQFPNQPGPSEGQPPDTPVNQAGFPGAAASGSINDGTFTGFIDAVRKEGAVVYSSGQTVPLSFSAPATQITYDIRFWPTQGINGGFNNVAPSQPRQDAVDIRPSRPGDPITIHVWGGVPRFQCVEVDAFGPCPAS